MFLKLFYLLPISYLIFSSKSTDRELTDRPSSVTGQNGKPDTNTGIRPLIPLQGRLPNSTGDEKAPWFRRPPPASPCDLVA